MTTVYLHIGAPKTATSTLQHVLAKNYRRMLESGVLYPRNVGHGNAHHTLVCDLIERQAGTSMPDIWYGEIPRGQAWQLLRDEMQRYEGSIHSVLVSSELFFGQVNHLDSMLADVASQLQGHDVRIIVYLRRQDQLYSSFYNQDVKGIRQWSQSAYQFYQTHQIFGDGYHAVLNKWSDAFGRANIIIRPFEPAQWPDSNIVKDFCNAIGLVSLNGTNAENSASLGMIQLYVKRCLNKVGYDKNLNETVLKILYEICPEEPAKGCVYINKRLYALYREQWQRENRMLSESYLGNTELFREPIPQADEIKLYEIDRFATALYIRNMFRVFKHGRFPKYRQLFSKATLLVLAEQNIWHALESSARSELLEWATEIEQ
jgi:hypothetical protein